MLSFGGKNGHPVFGMLLLVETLEWTVQSFQSQETVPPDASLQLNLQLWFLGKNERKADMGIDSKHTDMRIDPEHR